MDDSTAEKVLETAVENGVTFFDTADCYGEGLGETRLGRFVKTLSTEVVIATKIGRFPRPGWPDNFSLKQFRKHTEASLHYIIMPGQNILGGTSKLPGIAMGHSLGALPKIF